MGISNPMFFIGVVENTLDKSNQGRVQVRAFGVHGDNSEIPTELLPWAVCVAGNYDVNHTPPPINSFVFGMFLDGSEGQHPMILGIVPGQYAEKHDPVKAGWGVVPPFEPELLGAMGAPRDIGQVQKSKLVRGEDLDTTYIESQYANAVQKQKIADSDTTWSEPPPAYAAKYPYNRVIETARHSIEIDDTPNAERITIHHNSGAYIEIDAIGTVKERANSDRYEINIGTKHESSGHSVVTINGNSHVYVKGNKTEEIMGNYKRIVHGENEVTSGGQSYYNAGGHLFLRGASTKIEGNADRVTIFGKNEVQIEAEKQINNVSGHIKNTAMLTFSAYANKAVRLTTPQDIHIYAVGSIINTALGTAPTSLTLVAGSAGSQTSRGFNVTAPTFNVLSATASYSGILNAAAVNTAGLLATTGQIGALTVPGVTVVNTITAFGITTAGLSAYAYTGPVGSGAPGGTAPTAPIAFPGIPALLPAATSVPILGYALPNDGSGVANMPELPGKNTSIVERGYFALGHALGYLSPTDDNAKDI